MFYFFSPSFLVYYCLVVTFFWVFYLLSPSFLVDYPYLLINCWFINNPFFMCFCWVFNMFHVTLFWVIDRFCPSLFIHNPFFVSLCRMFNSNFLIAIRTATIHHIFWSVVVDNISFRCQNSTTVVANSYKLCLCPSFLIYYPFVLCPSFLVYNCLVVTLLLFKKFTILIVTFLWMLNFLRPSFLVYLPLLMRFFWVFDLLCPSFLINNLNSFRVTLLSYKRNFLCPSFFVYNCLVVTFFRMFDSLSPSRLIHNPHISITFFCLIYRNKGCKITSINSNSNTVNIIGRNNTNSSHCQCYSHY